MVKGTVTKNMESIGTHYEVCIEGKKLYDADVPSALTVQHIYCKKGDEFVYTIVYDATMGLKNAAREKQDQQNDLYNIVNFRNKNIGYICERTDFALLRATYWIEMRYGNVMYKGYVINTKEGLKVTVFDTEKQEQVALAERTGNDYELFGISEIATKVVSIMVVVGEVKTKHNYGWISFDPTLTTKNKKLLDKYDPKFKNRI